LSGKVETMKENRFFSPLKIGLLMVVLSYFLFNLHGMLTLEWIGEWNRLGDGFLVEIFVEDITSFVGIIFRFAASLVALAGISFYFIKKGQLTELTMKLLRLTFVFEAIYWLGLLSSAAYSVRGLMLTGLFNYSLVLFIGSLMSTTALLAGSIAIPVTLIKLYFTLNSNKLQKGAIKWGLIAGTFYILVFWLSNTSIWISAIRQKGVEYLTFHPENFLNVVLTAIGLLALSIYAAFFTKRYVRTETLERNKIGFIVFALGMYFLWNYLTWIFFGGDWVWSIWYAWFLGHNLDLWLLSAPLVGVALMFERKDS
jgi:hypothetical protein